MTTPLPLITPYSTAAAFFGPGYSWMSAYDSQRLSSYEVYYNMYWNVPETYKLVTRGTDDAPIYVPSARTIVEACNRFLAVGFDFAVDGGLAVDQAGARLAFEKLFRREDFYAKFSSEKRFGLVRGDSVWHITADPNKPAGRRISLNPVDPSSYFPITDEDDLDKIVGVHLVDQVEDPAKPGSTLVRRQTYRKEENGRISSELAWFEMDGWDDRPESDQPKLKRVRVVTPKFELPASITALPVYIVRNQRETSNPFGSSEIRGLERLATAINQTISDEELALALAGLGQYVTNSGPPRNDANVIQPWNLGPGMVIELEPGDAEDEASYFRRVEGIKSVVPSQDHLKYLHEQMSQGSGTPDIAIGAVDVQTAESGIALAFKMAPILSKNAEKENEMLGTYDHMYFDLLNAWFPEFESLTFAGVDITPTVGDPMPKDRAAIIAEVTSLMGTNPPLVTAEWARQYLVDRLGYDFANTLGAEVVDEAAKFASARDPFGERLRRELEGDTDPTS